MFLKKVDKKLLNNVGGKNVTSKRWTTNVDEQKCSLKKVDKKLLKKCGCQKCYSKKVDKKVKICNLSCQAEEVMTKRNEELKKENKIPYTVLLPSRIPAGISI